ncbi:MAG: sodium:solute symporter family protein [Myxococcales bacterium]|jgi:SSS family solute:Na+ symporter
MPPASFVATAALLAGGFLVLGAVVTRGLRAVSDFTVAGRSATASGVSGALLGALVGGAATVGTAEMAYRYGLSAWWFTLGGGIGCLVLGLLFARPVRRSRLETIPQFLRLSYGRPTALAALVGSALGSFLSIAAQLLAGAALLRAFVPVTTGAAVAMTAALVLGFMLAGGLKSFAAIGRAKLLALYGVLVVCALRALSLGATPSHLWRSLPREPFFDLFEQGTRDLSAGLSLVVGVLSTQIYVQAVFSASSERTARRGALLSALLMPPLGLLGIWVGLTLRVNGVQIESPLALPFFVQAYFPPAIAGLLWCALVITVAGAIAGLTLGIATNLVRDLYAPLRAGASERHLLFVSRGAVVLLVIVAAALASNAGDTPILRWSYLSMGLRGAGTVFPFLLAATRPGLLPARWALGSSLAGTAAVLAWPLIGGGEPLFVGLGLAGGLSVVGILSGRRGGAAEDARAQEGGASGGGRLRSSNR